MKNILVTGGAGFIGSHLLEELVKEENYNITVIDDLSTGKIENIPTSSRINFLNLKIKDTNIRRGKFDLIWHLAAKIDARGKGLKDFRDNVDSTETVTKMLKPKGHIYFSSSCAVYGNQSIVNEESSFQPICLYGYSKWMNELTIKNNCQNYTIFRFGNVFGERQDGSKEAGLLAVIAFNLKNDTIMQVFNQGKNYRDYIYVKDVVKALITINKQDTFQIGNNKIYNTLDLVKLSNVKWKYGAYNDNEIDTIKLDNTKIKKEGWKATLTVKEYIKGLK